ncbi:hypothetical protein [Pseudorhodobacter aquimaris]|uniref:hypothetical protein n=1 Tax=Pseudorhodobacter aquimaris TaxID=687412 RepID=UPI00067AB63D|nr:hypothetical protein [Pseudorhodobacter aquimaris]
MFFYASFDLAHGSRCALAIKYMVSGIETGGRLAKKECVMVKKSDIKALKKEVKARKAKLAKQEKKLKKAKKALKKAA